MLTNLYFIPGGRILYGAGSGVDVTLFNCFVLPFIHDSRGGIMYHNSEAAEIMSRGGGVGTNGSTLRPKDATVIGINGKSSGSVSWLNYLSLLTHLIIQGGSRRGAQMIALADWHPDVIEFIMCKMQNHFVLDKISKEVDDPYIKEIAESFLVRDVNGNPVSVRDKDFMTGANISVLISDDFMNDVINDEDWHLRFPDIDNLTPEQKKFYEEEWDKFGDVRKWEALGLPVKIYKTIKAKDIWRLINICARYSAEPGVIFIDHCNNMSNSHYYAPVIVTNPCGEQPLPPYAVCNLGAINLAKVYDPVKHDVDYNLLRRIVHVSQRFSDNVIDHSFYFSPKNEEMAKNERRVGKGVMGLADLMILLKLPYGSEEMLKKTDELFEFIAVESYLASTDLAKEKGSFPYFDAEKYLESGYMKRMPEKVREAVWKKGIRNVCSLTIAPTGSTGTMVGVSTGLEPYYSFKYYRSGRLGKFIEVNTAIAQKYFDENPGATKLPEWYVSALDIGPMEHVRVQGVIQRWVDSAISKTCNAPRTFTVEQNEELYLEAWRQGCKGVTVYVEGSRDTQILSVEAKENEFTDDVTDDDLTMDTRVCTIKFNEDGTMVKEC